MKDDLTPIEQAFKTATDDAMGIEQECLAQITALLEGKAIKVRGRECMLKIDRKRINGHSEPLFVVAVLNPTDSILRYPFKIERDHPMEWNRPDDE